MGRNPYNIGGENHDNSGMAWDVLKALAICVAIASAICWATSCSPRIIEHIVVQHDTTKVVKVDSTWVYQHDSVFVKEKGDTVYKYVEHIRYRDRIKVDTLVKIQRDSIAYEVLKEVKVEKELTWWQKFRQGAFWWLALGLIACLLWIFRKPILKLIAI